MRQDIIAIVCPDIHGRGFWKEVAQDYDGSVPFIFLGDYLDPYDKEDLTPDEVTSNFEEIWEFAQTWGDNVIMLLGNHDLSYYDRFFRCCRYAWAYAWYHEFIRKNWDRFKIAHQIKNRNITFLFTHAGVHPQWLEWNDFEMNWDAEYINDLFKMRDKTFNDRGPYRGGRPWVFGSPVWADIREFKEFIEYKDPGIALPRNVKQIVGHTQLREGMLDLGDICCIDSRQAFVITKDNKIEPYEKEKTSE